MQLTAERSLPAGRRARPIYRVFVSSTWMDLRPERQALQDALHRMEEMRFVGMEFFGTRPGDTHAASIDQVDVCEVFIGIIGFRYGSGITEAEYRRARELDVPCFIYFRDEHARQPDLTDNDGALEARLAAFKQELMREHTVKPFGSPAELAAHATADLHNWIVAQWVEVEPPAASSNRLARTPAVAPDVERVNVLRLLDRIQHDWVEGVLEASLHHRAWLELGLDWREDAVEHPWDRIVVAPHRPIQTLPRGETIAQVFAAAQNTLLILGEPGAGKTTTLLELARDLIRRARQFAAEPAPMVLALSTWSGRHPDLLSWLVEEMAVRYQVPKRLAQAWLAEGRLVLLLDGLDEVAEAARGRCVELINAFAREHVPPGLAVTCRVAEYSALTPQLQLRAAICLQPLTAAQVERYFAAAGPGLESLHQALQTDPGLRELARTPLLLSVMTMAWRDGVRPDVAQDAGPSDRRSQVFESYVSAMIRRRGKSAGAYPQAETRHWLAWLARQMKQQDLTFFALEQLQPSWLASGAQRLVYFWTTRLAWALALAVIWFGLAAPMYFWGRLPLGQTAFLMTGGAIAVASVVLGFAIGTLDALFARRPRTADATQSVYGRFVAMLGALVATNWLVQSVLAAVNRPQFAPTFAGLSLFIVIFGGAFCAPLDVRVQDIKPTDTMRWSWRLGLDRFCAMVVSLNLIVVLFTVAILGFLTANEGWRHAGNVLAANSPTLVGLAIGAAIALAIWRRRRQTRNANVVLGGVAVIVTCGLFGSLFGPERGGAGGLLISIAFWSTLIGLIGGFATGAIDPARARRTGMSFWLRVPIFALVIVGALLASLAGAFLIVLRDVMGNGAGRTDAIVHLGPIAGFLAVIAFLRFGGMSGLQHALLRLMLRRVGSLPRGAESFFNHAAQLAILQKVGFGYRFVHALLLDHLAAGIPKRTDDA